MPRGGAGWFSGGRETLRRRVRRHQQAKDQPGPSAGDRAWV